MADPTITVRGRSDLKAVERGLDRASGKVSSFASKAKRAVALGLAAASAAAVKLGIDSVKAASKLEESINAVRVSYGKAADGILKLGRNSAKSLGLSKSQLNDTAVQFSSFSQTIAGKSGNVVKVFRSIAGRATDFASVMNLDVNESLQKFQSGLAGETEPLRKFGIDLSAAKVEAFAYAQGIAKSGQKLTESQKVQARYKLLMKQTAKTQGDFANTSDSLANKQRILSARFEDAKAKLGTILMPVASKFFDLVADKGIPAIERLADWLERNQDEIEELGRGIGNTLLPPLETLAGLAADLAGFLADLPSPVKEVGIQAAIAAIAVWKLNAAIGASRTVVGGYIGGLRNAETRTRMLGTAARGAAGIGGLVALTQATQTSDRALGTLLATAGGAATGFAVGGPWGAAIGGAAGLVYGLATNTGKTSAAMNLGQEAAKGYAATLDQVSGAAQRATRETAAMGLQQAGAFDLARKLGISTQDLTGATLGHEKALARVRTGLEVAGRGMLAFAHEPTTLAGQQERQLAEDAENLSRILGFQRDELNKNQRSTRELSVASGKLSNALKGVKDRSKIVARVESRGWPETTRQVARLTKGLKLTPKQIRTVIKALGVDTTVKDVQKVQRNLKDTGRQKPDLKPFTGSFLDQFFKMDGRLKEGTGKVKDKLKGAGRQKPDMGPFLTGLSSGIDTGKSKASSGGNEIGNNLKSGLLYGISGAGPLLSGQVVSAVHQAIAAGRRAAKAKSPSKETEKLGRDLADGLALGMARGKGKNRKAGKDLVRSLLAGVRSGSSGVEKALDKITRLVEKRVKGKNEAAREKRILKHLRDEYKALQKNGKQQDKNTRKLDAALAKVKALKQASADYAASIRDSVVAFGSIINLGQGTGFGSLDQLITQMRARVEQAKKYADIIKQLQAAGLNKTTIQQLLDAGVEGGLGTAETILSGGQGAIAEINKLTKELTATGAGLGSAMAKAYHQAGIQAAQGLVRGLKSRQKELDRIATRMANALAKAVKKALGIKSPSRVFRDLGKQTALGLKIGLEDVHVKRAGTVLARELVDGFGRPQLSADAVAAGVRGSGLGEPVQIRIKLTADQLSALQRGKAVLADIDVARGAGVRSLG